MLSIDFDDTLQRSTRNYHPAHSGRSFEVRHTQLKS